MGLILSLPSWNKEPADTVTVRCGAKLGLLLCELLVAMEGIPPAQEQNAYSPCRSHACVELSTAPLLCQSLSSLDSELQRDPPSPSHDHIPNVTFEEDLAEGIILRVWGITHRTVSLASTKTQEIDPQSHRPDCKPSAKEAEASGCLGLAGHGFQVSERLCLKKKWVASKEHL